MRNAVFVKAGSHFLLDKICFDDQLAYKNNKGCIFTEANHISRANLLEIPALLLLFQTCI